MACSTNDTMVKAAPDAGFPASCTIAELAQCDSKATCFISQGIATCACIDGFEGNGVSCEVIDICSTALSPCSENAVCVSLAGIANCSCESGWQGDGLLCTNIDECAEETSTCDSDLQDCIDNEGGFSCTCKEGYVDNGEGCVIDPATFIADISSRPVIFEIEGIGIYEVAALGRVAVEIETETLAESS